MKTEFSIAYRCPLCGKMEIYNASIFAFSGNKKVEIYCPCGEKGLVMTTKDYKQYKIDIKCPICNNQHVYKIDLRELLKGEPIIYDCLKYSLELIFFGENKKVVKAVDEYQRALEEIIDEIEDYEYFVNSEIMMEYINILHDLAENNEIHCACGSTDVELRLLSDKIEIQCKSCENILSLPANSHNDLEEFKKVDHIFIEKKIFL